MNYHGGSHNGANGLSDYSSLHRTKNTPIDITMHDDCLNFVSSNLHLHDTIVSANCAHTGHGSVPIG